jgi:multicomponent Na+:H+ antiporter subunit D
MAAELVPLTVVLPLIVAAAMLAGAHFLPSRLPDVIATLTALAVAVACLALARHTLAHGPLAYWFGGWTPRPGVVLGIGFGVDPASAAIAAFVALLFAASFVFAWGYFEEVHAHFHILMLLFLAAMVGFILTRDLFNLFVWFEVMSVAAFALTAYRLETPSLAGALNFTVTNSLAAFMMLGGIGLLYARAGVLDFQALGSAVARRGHDPVLIGAFCLLAGALMIKAAIVPFQFWLSDAHAVAPSPLSVIFSGAMVSAGLFALAKLSVQVFFASGDAQFLIHNLFVGLGCMTAVLGGAMAWVQRHLKRMLAFSTIAHLGVMLIGVAAVSSSGLAGFLVYFVGHGLVKGTLFMLVGILLATKTSVDELELKGRGKDVWPAGLAMALAGLLLGGAPWGVLDNGAGLIRVAGDHALGVWATWSILFGTALTGAAVLRATGRIFLGLGSDPGVQADAPTQSEGEKANRPLWLMLMPCVVLLALALAPSHEAQPAIAGATALLAPALAAHSSIEPVLQHPASMPAWTSVSLALALAVFHLNRDRLPRLIVGGVDLATKPLFKGLMRLHTGLVGDYVMLIVVGLAGFSIALAFR